MAWCFCGVACSCRLGGSSPLGVGAEGRQFGALPSRAKLRPNFGPGAFACGPFGFQPELPWQMKDRAPQGQPMPTKRRGTFRATVQVPGRDSRRLRGVPSTAQGQGGPARHSAQASREPVTQQLAESPPPRSIRLQAGCRLAAHRGMRGLLRQGLRLLAASRNKTSLRPPAFGKRPPCPKSDKVAPSLALLACVADGDASGRCRDGTRRRGALASDGFVAPALLRPRGRSMPAPRAQVPCPCCACAAMAACWSRCRDGTGGSAQCSGAFPRSDPRQRRGRPKRPASTLLAAGQLVWS